MSLVVYTHPIAEGHRAFLAHEPACWGAGRTLSAAVGDLILSHTSHFKLVICAAGPGVMEIVGAEMGEGTEVGVELTGPESEPGS